MGIICKEVDSDLTYYDKLLKENEELKKALDKACEFIADNEGWIKIFGNEDFTSRFPNGVKTKEQWKEYLLKESEKQ